MQGTLDEDEDEDEGEGEGEREGQKNSEPEDCSDGSGRLDFRPVV